MENLEATRLDLSRWQRVQDLFAKIISTNIGFYSLSGECLSNPSLTSACCCDLDKPSSFKDICGNECIVKAILQTRREKENSYCCLHGLSYFSAEACLKERIAGVIVVGPVWIGSRPDEQACSELCSKLDIDAEVFFDRSREIRVFSHSGIHAILNFLHEMTVDSFLPYGSKQNKQLLKLMPRFPMTSNGTNPLFTANLPLDRLANHLLDIALHLVEGNSGSVLLINNKSRTYSIKAAHGIREEHLKQDRISTTEGVVGWMASNRRPILISKDLNDRTLQNQLKRPEIVSSMVVPMIAEGNFFGVFCVNANTPNKKFNSGNLALLDELAKLAATAFSCACSA